MEMNQEFRHSDVSRSDLEERLDASREPYFESDRDLKASDLLDRVLARIIEIDRRHAAGSTKIIEGRAEIIIGESGSGKTALINRALRMHPSFTGFTPGAFPEFNKCSWVVSVSIRAPSTMAHFGVEMLHASGYPIVPKRPDARIIIPLMRAHLRSHGVKVIIIDEVHALTRTKNATEMAKVQDLFRSLLNDQTSPVQMIFIGTEAALEGLNDDDGQLMRRSNIMRLQPLQSEDSGKAVKIIQKLASAAKVEFLEGMPDRLASRLIHATRGRLGLMIETTIFAIEDALKGGSALSTENFAAVFARQKGVSASMNPFVAQDFRNIEIKDLFDATEEASDDTSHKSNSRKR